SRGRVPAVDDRLRRRRQGVLVERSGRLDHDTGVSAAVLAGDRQGVRQRGAADAAGESARLGEMAVVLLVFMMVAALLARICTTLVAARPRFVVSCQMGFRTDRTSGEADGQKANSMPGMAKVVGGSNCFRVH